MELFDERNVISYENMKEDSDIHHKPHKSPEKRSMFTNY